MLGRLKQINKEKLEKILNKKIPFQDDIESIFALIETDENIEKLLHFLEKHPDLDCNQVWEKAISLSD